MLALQCILALLHLPSSDEVYYKYPVPDTPDRQPKRNTTTMSWRKQWSSNSEFDALSPENMTLLNSMPISRQCNEGHNFSPYFNAVTGTIQRQVNLTNTDQAAPMSLCKLLPGMTTGFIIPETRL
jgi:hypothetical protein